MLQNIWFVAAIWMGLALVASLISIWTGISVALIEIFVGVLAGNLFHLQANNEWIGFLAMLGSGVLTFLAGAEIDPRSLKENLRASALTRLHLIRGAFRSGVALRPICPRVVAASGADCGHRSFDDIGRGRLRGDD
jgi:Kef-type K+ transport system membrane component KefB